MSREPTAEERAEKIAEKISERGWEKSDPPGRRFKTSIVRQNHNQKKALVVWIADALRLRESAWHYYTCAAWLRDDELWGGDDAPQPDAPCDCGTDERIAAHDKLVGEPNE